MRPNSMKDMVKLNEIQTIIHIEQNGLKKIAQLFNVEILRQHRLYQDIDLNADVFRDISSKAFPNAFLQTAVQSDDEKFYFLRESYSQTLADYIDLKIPKEDEALKIFQQILKSIYSLALEQLPHRSIRPEQFVQVNGTWKLKSVVLNFDNNGFQCEYTSNSKYQSPEQYDVNFQAENIDPLAVQVWNLGSILLDLLLGTHKLSNEKIMKKFKNKQFTLQAINATIKISPELKKYLGLMLHYNPQKRCTLQSIFQNSFFSEQIAEHYKLHQSKATSEQGSMISSQKSMKQSMPITKKQEFYNIIPKDQLIQIDDFFNKENLLMSKRRQQIKDSTQIQDDDDFFGNLDLKTKVFKKNKDETKKMQTIKQKQKQQQNVNSNINLQEDPELKDIFSIYKTFIDRSQLLCISVRKFSQIPYDQQSKKQLILLNQFAVYYASLIQLTPIVNSLNSRRNIYRIDEDKFFKFIQTNHFKVYHEQVNQNYQAKQVIFEQIAQKLINLPQKLKTISKKQHMNLFIKDRNFKINTFADIKRPFRQVLKMTYDLISNLYNAEKDEQYCRLSFYAVYCMTIDKLYIPTDLKDNFSFFIEWNSLKSTRTMEINKKDYLTISVSQLQKYFDTAPIKTLIKHSKKILQKYYKV